MVSVISLCDLLNAFQYTFVLADYHDWPTKKGLCVAEAVFNSLGHQSRNLFIFMITLCLYLSVNRQWDPPRLRSFMNFYSIGALLFSLVVSLLPLTYHGFGFNTNYFTCS